MLALLAPLRRRTAETIALEDALGRVAAVDVVTGMPLPPFRNSQMDGFAARSAELPGVLPVAGEIAAAPGEPPPLAPGAVVRVMTGAPMPDGADTVVPVEDAALEDAGALVRLPGSAPGAFVREAGSDLPAGATIVPAGTRLGSRHLAAIAASGAATVPVSTVPRLAILSTGSELVEPGAPLAAGQLPDANGVALAAAARAAGATVVHRARVADDPGLLAGELNAAIAAGAELVVTSGGISMGAHEVVRELLEPRGGRVDVIGMQPGGPQALGAWGGVPVLCFPGNPVSSQLSFELFVAPVLRELAALPPAVAGSAPLAHAVASPAGRRQYLRGRRRADGAVEAVSGPGSHLVAGLARAELLLVVPEELAAVGAGEIVEVLEL